MTDQSFADEAEDHGDDTAFNDVDESSLYEEMEKRVGGDEDEGEPEPQKNWQEEAQKAEKRFQDQQRRAKAERKEKQELKKRLEELEARIAKPAASSDDDDLDFGDENEDPIGTIAKIKALALKMKQGEQQERLTQAQQEKEAKRVRGLASSLQESETAFRTVKPDYDKAVDHFKKARREELIVQGVAPGEVDREMTREFLDLIERAEATDKDPAEVVYTLAMRRGYSLDAAKEKLQTIRDGQKAGRSLSTAGGRNGDASEMTYARAAQLKGPALLKAYAQIREQEKRQARR